MLNQIMDKMDIDSFESLQNIYSSYSSDITLSPEDLVARELVSESFAFRDLPEVIEELVVVPVAGSNAHPVLMKLMTPSKLQKVFAIFKDISGRLPALTSVRSSTDDNIAMVSTCDDFFIENNDIWASVEIKHYEFSFADAVHYQHFIAEVAPYVSFFRMPKGL